MTSPTKQPAGHAVPRGVRTLPTGCSFHHAGFPSKLPAFWEQEAAIYHQENAGGGGFCVHRLSLKWQEGRDSSGWKVVSVICPLPNHGGHGEPS